MRTIVDWLRHNKEWVFSGVGVATVAAVFSLLYSLLRPKASTPTAIPKFSEPPLRLNFAFGALTYDEPPYLSDQMIIFTVTNPSDRPVQLASIHLPLQGANMAFPHLGGEKRLPCMVDPGTSLKFWVQLSSVQASARSRGHTDIQIHAVATDGLGNEYASNQVAL